MPVQQGSVCNATMQASGGLQRASEALLSGGLAQHVRAALREFDSSPKSALRSLEVMTTRHSVNELL